MTDKTLDYYNQNAAAFAEGTADADFRQTQDKFLSLLGPDAAVLDFGCGAGRDAKYFAERGFQVEAVDGSEELCKIAAAFAGVPVRQMFFQDLNECEKYDGIWACASILHLPRRELADVMRKMAAALKPEGIIYTSFKYGTFEGERNGRYFTDLTEETFQNLLEEVNAANTAQLNIIDQWISADVRPGRESEKWLNVILRMSK